MSPATRSAGPSNLTVRVLTAAVGAPGILALLYLAPPWAFYLLVFAAVTVGSWELLAMTHGGDRVARGIGIVLCQAVSLLVYFEAHDPRVVLGLLVGIPRYRCWSRSSGSAT